MCGGEPCALLFEYFSGLLSAPFGLASLSWFWLFLMPFTAGWIVTLGFTVSLLDFIISVLASLDPPRYRMRRRKKPPDKRRRLSGKKRRALLREHRKYLAAVNKWLRDHLEDLRLEIELKEFLDGTGIPLHLQGRFSLWTHDDASVSDLLASLYGSSEVPVGSAPQEEVVNPQDERRWVFFDPTLEVALNERRWVFYGEEPGVPYQTNVEVEVAQFLDCDGVTPDQQGKFNLFQHDPDILEHYVTNVNPDPTSLIRLLKYLHPSSTHENIDHEVNAHSAILRAKAAKVANPTYNLWMLESASLNANAQVRPKVRRSKKSRKKERRSEAFYRTPAINWSVPAVLCVL